MVSPLRRDRFIVSGELRYSPNPGHDKSVPAEFLSREKTISTHNFLHTPLFIFANQATQQAITLSHCVKNILMNLEDFVDIASFTSKLRDVLNVSWVIHRIFY